MNAFLGRIVVFLLMILIVIEGKAYAYIDPGTGSMLWQLLFAAGVGSLFYLRKAIAWLGRLRKRKNVDATQRSIDTSSLNTGE